VTSNRHSTITTTSLSPPLKGPPAALTSTWANC
jgi:hypothetical protein